jgi:restriction system protein
MTTRDDLPSYSDLMYPTLRAVKALGGSARAREIADWVIEAEGFTENELEITYGREPDKAVLVDRLDWARSYSKLCGALDSPRRGLFILSSLGQELLDLDEETARDRLRDLDRQVRSTRQRTRAGTTRTQDGDVVVETADLEDEEQGEEWRAELLARLHELSPEGFEEFVIYVLKSYGIELERIGGAGDEGIDGIGRAPLSPVLSSRVAVQAKRYNPDGPAISRDVVALFQRDAAAVGAERAILVTLGRVSAPARKAATQTTPNVELIDGDRLVQLCRDQEIGIVISLGLMMAGSRGLSDSQSRA